LQIVGQYADTSDVDDWLLVELEIPFKYEDVTFDHLLIRSRWVGRALGLSEPTAVFIVLVPKPYELKNPFVFDSSLYIAWGFSANARGDIKR
jgi:hypothetical protein